MKLPSIKTYMYIHSESNWLKVKKVSAQEYVIESDSFRESGDPIVANTLLAIDETVDGVVILSEDEYVGVFEALWHGVYFDFRNQERLVVYGSLKQIREALSLGIFIGACAGDE